MSDDEQKYDIPDFSHIEDRVERARAKAAAVRKAKKEAEGRKTISENSTVPPQQKPEAVQSSQSENTTVEASSQSHLSTILVILVLIVIVLYFILS